MEKSEGRSLSLLGWWISLFSFHDHAHSMFLYTRIYLAHLRFWPKYKLLKRRQNSRIKATFRNLLFLQNFHPANPPKKKLVRFQSGAHGVFGDRKSRGESAWPHPWPSALSRGRQSRNRLSVIQKRFWSSFRFLRSSCCGQPARMRQLLECVQGFGWQHLTLGHVICWIDFRCGVAVPHWNHSILFNLMLLVIQLKNLTWLSLSSRAFVSLKLFRDFLTGANFFFRKVAAIFSRLGQTYTFSKTNIQDSDLTHCDFLKESCFEKL